MYCEGQDHIQISVDCSPKCLERFHDTCISGKKNENAITSNATSREGLSLPCVKMGDNENLGTTKTDLKPCHDALPLLSKQVISSI